MLNTKNNMRVKLVSLAVLASCLGACSTVEFADRDAFKDADQLQALALSQPTIEGVLSLEDALARSFVYNVNYKVQREKAFTALASAGTTLEDYLPRATAYLSQTNRSNQQASVGQRVDDMGAPLPEDFFTASDQSSTVGSLTATWNLIDFGLTYLESEKRKRLAQNQYQSSLIQCSALASDVVSTYWRARAYERALEKNEWLRWRIETGLDLSRQNADASPDMRSAELMFQRELIDLYRWYDSIYVSVAPSKAKLASLANLPAGTEFKVDTTLNVSFLPDLPTDHVELVKTALLNRPEINQRILMDEVSRISNRQDVLRLFPNLSVMFGANADSNSFLLNNSFTSVGANLSWSLYDIARVPDTLRRQTDQLQVTDLETQLVANAVTSQVAMSVTEFEKRNISLTYAWRANTIQAEIVDRKRAEFGRGDAPETHLIKEELLRELAILRRDLDEAAHQAARVRVLNALGQGPNCNALPISSGYEAVHAVLAANKAA